MRRWAAMAVYAAGWFVFLFAFVAPIIGIGLGLSGPGRSQAWVFGAAGYKTLFLSSILLSVVATGTAMLLGLMPAAVLGSAHGTSRAVLTGLTLAPLLIPPQVYAYGWGIALSPASPLGAIVGASGGQWVNDSVKAGLISAGWLWPVATLIVAAGWRASGQCVYELALLDTTAGRAFVRAVLPGLRPYLVAAGMIVFAVTLVEYAIPHLSLARVYPTALQMLIDAGASPRQIMSLAGQQLALMLPAVAVAVWSLRDAGRWQTSDDGPRTDHARGRPGWWLYLGSAMVWLICVGLPAAIMLAWLRVPGKWKEGFLVFADEWLDSLLVALTAGLLAVVVAMSTALLRPACENRRQRIGPGIGLALAVIVALIPPAALAKGFVLFYNRAWPWEALFGRLATAEIAWVPQWLSLPVHHLAAGLANPYEHSPAVWVLGLAARYSAVAVLIAWLAAGRTGSAQAEQARIDGADRFALLAWVTAPAAWPSLVAAGLIVATLSMFEVIVSQMLSPAGFSAIAQSILNQMHYGQDDMVITTSLFIMAAGILLTQGCGRLLLWRQR